MALKVAFVVCEKMLATSLTLPLELLRAAEDIAKTKPKGSTQRQQLSVQVISDINESVTTHTGIRFDTDNSIDDAGELDLIYLPALWRNPNTVINRHHRLIAWLRDQYENGVTIAGVGTGCCFMAEAGILDGKPATTHWHHFDFFQKKYPQINLKRQYFITQAGNLYCTGSVNSLGDLTVHFIQKYFSREVATHVEQHFFHEIRRAYEKPSSLIESNNSHPDEEIVQSQIWIQSNQSKHISVQNLAEQFGMSMRSFNRRFKTATGVSPLTYVQQVRMETAKDLLKTTNLSIGEVMDKVGYHDGSYFTNLFRKIHGTTPSQYRTTVRAKLFSLNT
ncbi:GlxA family transcriptional regulator [Teredinibacter sp. KSP-S5-2]|uniref:GlxA family transcriptional regulator n=1 Tax=Teredinibacter sp. KSP-S5-2 TaxID=3034506 RepID=UPI0029347315|nr:helix-turn-helix domain-containing protein [Teredinibacter sp. KSP-S5-2]WNO10902.1 helix-turn-helix domain-containing protein [Teredinibacter sp. KSP-S5-2]